MVEGKDPLKPINDDQVAAAKVPKYGYRVTDDHPITLDMAAGYLSRARRGISTPDEIEAELAANGLPPFASFPDSALFDPLAEVWWTLPMTAAWIIWRTRDAVRRAWSAYRREVRVWTGPHRIDVPKASSEPIYGYQTYETVMGYTLERYRDLHLFQVLLRSTFNDPEDGVPLVEGERARIDLWHSLEGGELVAEGIRNPGQERAPLRDAEWIDLDHYYEDEWPTDALGRQGEKAPRYVGLRVRRARVVELWPAIVDEEIGVAVSVPVQRPDRREAIRAAVKELWPDGLPQGLMVKQRDRTVQDWFKQRGLQQPSGRTILRALSA